MQEQVMKAISILIDRANELNLVVEDKERSPLESGRAAWERKGIILSLKTLIDETGICDFEDLFENGKK